MTKLLLVPVLLLAACGDNLEPDQQQAVAGAEDDASPVADNPFQVGFTAFPNDCTDNSVELRARFSYEDAREVLHPSCQFALADGTVLDSCFTYYPFPTAQNVMLTVTDLDTGASGQFEQVVQGPGSLDATLEVASDGLSISWEGHSIYGGVADQLNVDISITPSENVIVDDASIFTHTTGTVNVTAAGTYTVRLGTGISFADVGGCGKVIEKTIEVVCDGDAH